MEMTDKEIVSLVSEATIKVRRTDQEGGRDYSVTACFKLVTGFECALELSENGDVVGYSPVYGS
jgi:hypothetical protein